MNLTRNQLERQDLVDSKIFELISNLNIGQTKIPWNIEMIAEVRETIKSWVVGYYERCDEQTFYPFISD